MLNLFLPNEHVKSIFHIDFSLLKDKGIRGIIVDLDNTLVAWDEAHATEEIKNWFKQIQDNGLKVVIISNNNEERVKIFSDPLHIPYIHSARKPLRKAFVEGARRLGLNRDEVVVIGDQILTDVLGGNMAGFYTILVVPLVRTDAAITTFNRKLERLILDYMRKKGKINWEE